jgi:hypothetical protein
VGGISIMPPNDSMTVEKDDDDRQKEPTTYRGIRTTNGVFIFLAYRKFLTLLQGSDGEGTRINSHCIMKD